MRSRNKKSKGAGLHLCSWVMHQGRERTVNGKTLVSLSLKGGLQSSHPWMNVGLNDLFLTTGTWWKWWWDFWGWATKVISAVLGVLDCSLWEISSHAGRIPVSSAEGPVRRGTESSHQQPVPPCQACEGTSLEAYFPTLVKPLDDDSLIWHQVSTSWDVLSWNVPMRPLVNSWQEILRHNIWLLLF